ncbi:hypothetical protein N24_1801 [Corynebacterium suranareeae]|uniref:Uncharacterized protein n=1 Tax=Corynebacterium suranareeae TaxID=2506452 RepID=A0A160PSD6_9CORY|nr:hypothetical protein [Corynebacterium suranareeae]BAU96063.1 hypothetical protein N24_1801 [Corynebacterium suranareeae]
MYDRTPIPRTATVLEALTITRANLTAFGKDTHQSFNPVFTSALAELDSIIIEVENNNLEANVVKDAQRLAESIGLPHGVLVATLTGDDTCFVYPARWAHLDGRAMWHVISHEADSPHGIEVFVTTNDSFTFITERHRALSYDGQLPWWITLYNHDGVPSLRSTQVSHDDGTYLVLSPVETTYGNLGEFEIDELVPEETVDTAPPKQRSHEGSAYDPTEDVAFQTVQIAQKLQLPDGLYLADNPTYGRVIVAQPPQHNPNNMIAFGLYQQPDKTGDGSSWEELEPYGADSQYQDPDCFTYVNDDRRLNSVRPETCDPQTGLPLGMRVALWTNKPGKPGPRVIVAPHNNNEDGTELIFVREINSECGAYIVIVAAEEITELHEVNDQP